MVFRRILPLLSLLVFAACAGTPKGEPARPALTPQERVTAAREAGEAVLQAQAALLWQSWTEGAAVDLTRPYADHPVLLEAETLEALRALRPQAPPEEARRLELLYRWLLGEQVARRVAANEEALADAYAAAAFATAEGSVPLRDLGRRLAEAPDPAVRRRLYAAATGAVEALQPVLAVRDARLVEAAKAHGYPSLAALAAAVRGVDRDAAVAEARDVLAATTTVYRELLERRSRAVLGLAPDAVRRADLPRLLLGPNLEAALPAATEVRRVRAVFKEMALDPEAGGRVRWQAEEAPRKSPQPLCLSVETPRDVRLSVIPRDGLTATRALLREAAVCRHLGSVGDRPFEFRRLGLEPFTATTGALFAGLAADPAWLASAGGGDEADEAATATLFERLFVARRHAARLLLATGAETDAASLLGRAYGFPLEADDLARLPLEGDPLWESAEVLSVLGAAARLELGLHRRFGARWWASPGPDRPLLALWEPGSTVPFPRLVNEAPFTPPGEAPLSTGAALAAWATRLLPPR